MTLDQIRANASTLIIAGSETTATALSGTTYLLCQNPDALAKLVEEVRSSFSSEDEITLLSVQKLKYMLAVLDESLRLFPPVPGTSPRVAHKGGDVICDVFLPENVSQQLITTNLKSVILTVCFQDDFEHLAVGRVPIAEELCSS